MSCLSSISPVAAPRGQTLEGQRALVIDAPGYLRTEVVGALTGWGLHTEVLASPVEGIARLFGALAESHPFDLCLFSPSGHSLVGEQFAPIIRSDPRFAALVLIHLGLATALGRITGLRELGFFDTTPVPLDKARLFDSLARACLGAAPAAGPAMPGGVIHLIDRKVAQGAMEPRSVLVLDPDPAHRRHTSGVLRRQGHRVFETASGEDALATLAKHAVDALITAMTLPDMDIPHLVALCAAFTDPLPTPVVIALGSAQNPTLEGLTAVLPTPYRSRDLLDTLAKAWREQAAPKPSERPEDNKPKASVLDHRALSMIVRLSPGPEFLAFLLNNYLSQVTQLLARLHASFGQDPDAAVLQDCGHILADASAAIGAVEMYQLGMRARAFPVEHYATEAYRLIEQIEASFARTRVALEEHLGDGGLS